MKKTLKEIANENGLQVVDTTLGREAIIGFDSFVEAEKLAEKYGLDISQFCKRDGSQIYEWEGFVCEAIKISAEDYGCDFNQFTKDDLEGFYEDNVMPFIGEMESFEAARALLDSYEKIYNAIVNAKDGEIVLTYEGRYYDTVMSETMSFYHDGKTRAVGLVQSIA